MTVTQWTNAPVLKRVPAAEYPNGQAIVRHGRYIWLASDPRTGTIVAAAATKAEAARAYHHARQAAYEERLLSEGR